MQDYLAPVSGSETPGKSSRLARLEQLLKDTHGIGVLVYADLDQTLVPAHKYDMATDILHMKRRDTAWSICLAQGIAAALRCFNEQGGHATTVDIYYDVRMLRVEHCVALTETITKVTTKIIRHAARQGLGSPTFKPRLRRFEGVEKPADSSLPNQFQVGTQAAHYLCQLAKKSLGHQQPPIYSYDITPHVVDTLLKFKSPT